jgi:hypothetical protein
MLILRDQEDAVLGIRDERDLESLCVLCAESEPDSDNQSDYSDALVNWIMTAPDRKALGAMILLIDLECSVECPGVARIVRDTELALRYGRYPEWELLQSWWLEQIRLGSVPALE